MLGHSNASRIQPCHGCSGATGNGGSSPMFQQQTFGRRTPFHASNLGTAAIAFAVAGAVAIGAVISMNLAASRQAAAPAAGPIAIAHPVLNTGDSVDLINSLSAAKPGLN